MSAVAIGIGYAVMVVGAMALVLLALWLAAETLWRWWIAGMNTADIMEATAAWRKEHPEKFKRWRKRNGVDDGNA